MKMKKVLCFLMVIVCCVASITVPVHASSPMISANTVEGNPGDEVTVDISINGNPGVSYLRVLVGYSSELSIVGVENKGIIQGMFTKSQYYTANPYYLTWANDTDSASNGVLASITFKIADTATSQEIPIVVTCDMSNNENLDDVVFTTSNGCVNVKENTVSVTLNKEKLNMKVGETDTLVATVSPSSENVIVWESNDTSVATVDANGIVTGIKPGTAIIQAIVGDAVASCEVTVEEIEVSNLEIIQAPILSEYDSRYLPNFTGMKVQITYDNNTSECVEVTENNVSYIFETVYCTVTAGETIINISEDNGSYTIACGGKTCIYNGINFYEGQAITSIEVSNFSLTGQGMSAKVVYEDDSQEEIELEFLKSTADSTSFDGYVNTEKGFLHCYMEESMTEGQYYVSILQEDITITLDTVLLKINGAYFKVNDGENQLIYNYAQNFEVGSTVTLTATGENFAYWMNESNKIISTEMSYSFTINQPTEFTVVYKNAVKGENAYVEFVSDYDQVLRAQNYSATSKILLPVGPSKSGYTFKEWSMTVSEIKEAIQNGETYIRVTPVYQKIVEYFDVTVVYDGNLADAKVYHDVLGYEFFQFEAKSINGRKFAYWSDAISDGNVLGTSETYSLYVNKDVTIYAIYVDSEEEVKVEPTITMTSAYKSVDAAGTKKVHFGAMRNIPDTYTLQEHGVLYGTNSAFGEEDAEDVMIIGGSGVAKQISKTTGNTGLYVLNVSIGSKVDTVVYARGYMILQNIETKEVITVYSNILSGSYNSLEVQ